MITKVVKMIMFALAGFLVILWPCTANAAKYEYDQLNRLTRVVYDENTSIEYTYDAVGNRTRRLVIEPPNPDINRSGKVNLADFAKLAESWLQPVDHKPADLNLDGVVDMTDLSIMADYWLKAGEPL